MMSKLKVLVLGCLLTGLWPFLHGVTLQEKVGQMLILGFHEPEVIKNHIRNYKPGGVILYNHRGERNIQNPEQLKELLKSLKSLDSTLLVSVDQEGGPVSRIKKEQGFRVTIDSAEVFGDANDKGYTYREACKLSEYLHELGIDINYAPVLDLKVSDENFISKRGRAYHFSPEMVYEHASQFVNGMRKHQILPCLKHFPGHGSSVGDTHKGFVDITNTWNARELEPYKKFIENGFTGAIMTTHCVNRQIDDSGLPATLSKKTLTGLLREEMGFKGLIITDDLTMGAVSNNYPLEEVLRLSINAGADLLILANHEQDDTAKAVKLIVSMVNSGEIPESRIDEAYQRVQKFKQRL